MDIDFANYHWDSPGSNIPDESPLIDDLFFGIQDKNSSGRTRKVTITEITEDVADQQEEDWTILNGYPSKEEAVNEDVTSDDSDEEAIMETEEVFQILDDVVQDWKIKLECVVGDGLKKLRKAGKEKKLMIKYLPGEHGDVSKKLGVPKATIMKDWKTDFNHIVNGIQKKLDKLTKDKVKEVDSLYNDKFLYTNTSVKEVEDLNKNKKEVINIDCRDNKSGEKGSCYTGLKQLIRELNKMCEKVASTNNMMNENFVPIYNMYNDNQNNGPSVVANQYETPLNQYLKHLMTLPPPNPPQNFTTPFDPELIAKNQANILDALEDFRIKQSTQSKFLKMKMKENRRDTNRVSAQRKMIQRKANKKGVGIKARQEKKAENRYSLRMKHYNRDGKDHYLIIKKAEPVEKVEVEDIFAEWRSVALDDTDDRKRQLTPQRTPRARKLSHREQRKEMLKEASTPPEGPLLYSDALKKNLKYRPNNAPVEDIFEAWRDYLQELDDLLSSSLPSSTTSSRHTSGEDNEISTKIQNAKQEQISESSEKILETALVYQKELHSCGQPTVPLTSTDRIKADVVKSFSIAVNVCGTNSKDNIENNVQDTRTKKIDARKKSRTMRFPPEIYFAGWRHNLTDISDLPRVKNLSKKKQYETEEYFRVWRRNFFMREKSELSEEIAERRKRRQIQPKMMPEKIFNEWLHNFHFKQRHAYKYGSLRRHNSKKEVKENQENPIQDQENETPEMVNENSLKYKSRSSRQRRSRKKKNDWYSTF